MAFPAIPTSAAGRVLVGNEADTTATRTFPSLSSLTHDAGDLLVAVIVAYQSSVTNTAFSGWGGGFTEFHDSSSSTTMAIGAAYKWSTGSETGTFDVTQAATITGHAVMILMSIPGAHATSPPEAGSRASGTSAAADPASFNPSWAAEDILWISVAGSGETSTTGSWTGLTTQPTNYSDLAGGQTTDVVGGTDAAVAFRQLNADSEDVGTWTLDTSNARNAAVVIAVRPAPSGTTGTIAVTQDNQTSAASGVLGYTGIVAVNQADQTSAASGTVSGPITGTIAVTQAAQTATASGTVTGPVTGTVAVIQADQTSAASGTFSYSGTVAVTQATQTSSASGQLGYTGTSTTIQAGQISTATGQLGYTGTSTTGQATQTATASGTVAAGGAIVGTAAVTQANQTAAAAGVLGYSGTSSVTQANQISAASGVLGLLGAVAAIQAGQTAAGFGFNGELPILAGHPLNGYGDDHEVTAERHWNVTEVR